ncbi:MAG TPA: aromatic-ring-hydroxylating dioxygenase subunit beta [Bryobacteraceae bacterium]|nr:aromatic-ring-hydroxylating dioxygenase subunit beta [Bryobacteraceae bacterium]
MGKSPKRTRRPAAPGRRRRVAALARERRLPAQPRLDLRRCEQFLLHEARLLDEGKFDDWLALFTLDAWYWVPSEPDQANPVETVSLIYDDRRLLETRVRRLASPRMYSQEPRSRTSRIIANVTLEDVGPHPTLPRERGRVGWGCTARSKFMMIEYRREQQRIFGGTMLHRLVLTGGRILIAWKRVDLVNCDAPLDGITVPF